MSTEFSGFASFAPHQVWRRISEAISGTESEVYSYTPGRDSDPFDAEGSLWSFNYFWYNKKLKRILFFRGRAVSANAPFLGDEAYVPEGYDIMGEEVGMEL